MFGKILMNRNSVQCQKMIYFIRVQSAREILEVCCNHLKRAKVREKADGKARGQKCERESQRAENNYYKRKSDFVHGAVLRAIANQMLAEIKSFDKILFNKI